MLNIYLQGSWEALLNLIKSQIRDVTDRRVLFLNEVCSETDQSETSINETSPTQK